MSFKYLPRMSIFMMTFMILLSLTACGLGNSPTIPASTSPTASFVAQPSTLEPTAEPTPTPEPLVASVNGEGITLASYQAELDSFAAGQGKRGTELATDEKNRVLDDLIDKTILAQAAAQGGFTLDATALQSRVDNLVSQLGSEQALKDWMVAHGYDDASFRRALTREAAAAWMRAQIAAGIP